MTKAPAATKLGAVTVVPDETAPEILADAIVEISKAAKKLTNGPLKMRAILVLLRDAIPGSMALSDIQAVLEAAAVLDKKFVSPSVRP